MSLLTAVLSASQFEQTIAGPLPVLVDFWAPWCGPCKAFRPIVKKVADAFDGQMRVVTVNIDTNHGMTIAKKYRVRSLPTLILFENDEPTEFRVAGAVSEEVLRKKLVGVLTDRVRIHR